MAGFTITSTNHTSFTVSSLDRAIGLFQRCARFRVAEPLAARPEVH